MTNFSPRIPLLIPSFSSKGNLLIYQSNGTYVSDNYSLLQTLDMRVSHTYLVSAYDTFYGYMPSDPDELPETEYLFVDSGGYETGDSYDLSERNKFNYHVKPWDRKSMEAEYSKITQCPKFHNTKIVLSTFDNSNPFEQQLQDAISLTKAYPEAVVDFLVKGYKTADELITDFTRNRDELCAFSILGFTEKELGNTLRDRVVNLIKINQSLNNIGWNGKIHIFGGLEPRISRLYYYAGADIIDGLSWQRMNYRNGNSSFSSDSYYLSLPEHENRYLTMLDNLSVLQALINELCPGANERVKKAELLWQMVGMPGLTVKEVLERVEG